MTSFKRSLRMKKDDLKNCEICNELDQEFDLICCASCNKYFHLIKCLKLNETTLNLIKQNLNSSSSSSSSSKLAAVANVNSADSEWCCLKCKTCCICRNSNRSTRFNFNKADNLEICERCNNGYHRYCAKINLDTKNSTTITNSVKKLCLNCLKLTNKPSIKLKRSDNGKQNSSSIKLANKLSNDLKLSNNKLDGNLKNLKNENSRSKPARLTRSKSISSDVNSNGL